MVGRNYIINMVCAHHFRTARDGTQKPHLKFSFCKPFVTMGKWLAETILSMWFVYTISEQHQHQFEI
jgi:hypothetical protein